LKSATARDWIGKNSLRIPAAALLLLPLAAQQETDPVLRAMRDEIERSRQLRVVDAARPPYFIEYTLNDVENLNATASLGALVGATSSRSRVPQVQVRVGSYQLDQTGHLLTGFTSSTRLDPEQWPLDDDYPLLRQCLWLATDRAYKAALDSYGRKEALLKNVSAPAAEGDFWKADPVRAVKPVNRVKVDAAKWSQQIVRLSGIFNSYPEIFNSGVDGTVLQGITYQVNSEGTVLRYLDTLLMLRARGESMAADGMTVRDAIAFQALDVNGLPSEEALRVAIRGIAENIRALRAAPAGEAYVGPVLFEPAAAAQLLAQLIGDNVRLPRKPLTDPGRPVPFPVSEFEGRLGSRVMPEWISVTDDATLEKIGGRPAMGYTEFDMDGVRPKPVTLIEKGMLKNVLLTRQPVKGFTASTGNARLPGPFGTRTAAISNLIVSAAESAPLASLKQQLIAQAQQRNKPYGLLVRKLDYPSGAPPPEIQLRLQQSASATRPISPPVLVYRVYPDGREELVRGLRFRNLTTRALREIVAASRETVQFDFINNGAIFALMGLSGYLAPTSVVSPGLLFEELELEPAQDSFSRPPLVTPPPAEH
jgi:hypothetical protein